MQHPAHRAPFIDLCSTLVTLSKWMFAVSFLFSCGMVGEMIDPDNTHQVSISVGFTIVGEVIFKLWLPAHTFVQGSNENKENQGCQQNYRDSERARWNQFNHDLRIGWQASAPRTHALVTNFWSGTVSSGNAKRRYTLIHWWLGLSEKEIHVIEKLSCGS